MGENDSQGYSLFNQTTLNKNENLKIIFICLHDMQEK